MSAIDAMTYRDALMCFTNPTEKFDFAKISAPVLLMTGEHDRLAPPHEIHGVAERIFDASARPDVRFEMIEDAGHVCNLEQPDPYTRILSEFVGRILS
jgi:pimeloyl-ACP methyl ester carboxylesterase